jgi:uncharacterized protein (DUF1778 family)
MGQSDMKKDKVIHCRVTGDEHAAITSAAQAAGLSVTQFVISAAKAQAQRSAD